LAGGFGDSGSGMIHLRKISPTKNYELFYAIKTKRIEFDADRRDQPERKGRDMNACVSPGRDGLKIARTPNSTRDARIGRFPEQVVSTSGMRQL
jgi:hypothetical protein